MTTDPRVERTRLHVLQQARELIAADGTGALTYTALAKRAQVTRPTLYRHWPTPTELLVDLVLQGGPTLYPYPGTDAPTVVRAFLRSLRDGMGDPALAGAFSALISAAEHDPTARSALHEVTQNRQAALNTLLAPSSVHIQPPELAQLSGAVLFQRFIARTDVTDAFIDEVTDRWWHARPEHRHDDEHP
ncbi:MAG: TetR/AcrR family transcriptional regulator [Mycobacteriaceae bacterium]